LSAYADLAELKASDEYQAAGVIGRENLVRLYFPDEFATWSSDSRQHLMDVAYDEEDVGAPIEEEEA
jgi:hypothetical protein